MTRILLPWPNKILWPNSHVHWRKKANAAKVAKSMAFHLAREAGVEAAQGSEPIRLRLTFRPAIHRRYDLDGALASQKHALDGLALAMGVDDSRFTFELVRGEPATPATVEVEVIHVDVDQIPVAPPVGLQAGLPR